jgi:hypothetical protein
VFVAFAVFVAVMYWMAAQGAVTLGYDAHAYFQAAALDDPYRATIEGGFDAAGGLYEYKYPPPLAQVLAPIRMLGIPWPAFFAAWTILLLASLYWMGRRWTLLLLFFPAVLGELWLGNVNLLIAFAIVVGFEFPAAWAFVILTKLTTGIGLVWFVVRREWRNLAIALGATGAIAAVSWVLAPELWRDFLLAMETQTGATLDVPRQAVPLSLPVRLVIAAIVIAWGAWTDRRWVVPLAVGISVPFLWWNVLAIWIAAIPLWAWRPDRSAAAAAPATAVEPAR